MREDTEREEVGKDERPSRLAAIVRLHCPRCRRGPVFRSLFRMYESCPVCGHRFEREPGFFVGAMYVSYGLAAPLCALTAAALHVVFPSLGLLALVGAAGALLLVLSPWLVRYSRVIWMHMMWRIDPEG